MLSGFSHRRLRFTLIFVIRICFAMPISMEICNLLRTNMYVDEFGSCSLRGLLHPQGTTVHPYNHLRYNMHLVGDLTTIGGDWRSHRMASLSCRPTILCRFIGEDQGERLLIRSLFWLIEQSSRPRSGYRSESGGRDLRAARNTTLTSDVFSDCTHISLDAFVIPPRRTEFRPFQIS